MIYWTIFSIKFSYKINTRYKHRLHDTLERCQIAIYYLTQNANRQVWLDLYKNCRNNCDVCFNRMIYEFGAGNGMVVYSYYFDEPTKNPPHLSDANTTVNLI